MNLNEEEHLYTVKEIANMLRVSLNTAYREIDRGSLKSMRIGHTIRVKESEWRKYLDSITQSKS
jgi:excisionase family DNA binding protein